MITDKKKKREALYRLEWLISTGGDKEEINKIRAAMKAKDTKSPHEDFDVARYKKLKKSRVKVNDKQIAVIMGISEATLKRAKMHHGLAQPRSKRK